MLDAVKRGLRIVVESLSVVGDHPKLAVFPLAGAAATGLVAAAIFATGLVLQAEGGGLLFLLVPVGILLYLVGTFFGTFFTVALVYCVNEVFHGREPTLSDGLIVATRKIGPILVWSIVATTVGVVIQRLAANRLPIGAQIAASLFQFGWAVTTFFIVPVIVFEDVGVREMFSKSATTFQKTWGETLSSGFGIDLVQFGIFVGGSFLVILLTDVLLLGGVLTGILHFFITLAGIVFVVLASFLLGSTTRAIIKTALYVYAAEGREIDRFESLDFETLGQRTERAATPGEIDANTRPFAEAPR